MFNAGVYQSTSIKRDPFAVLKLLDTVLAEASAKQIDIVQFPELFLCGYDISPEDTLKYAVHQGCAIFECMKELAVKHSIAFGIGYAESEFNSDIIYNSCCVIDATGKVVLNYRKTHLWDPTMEGEKVTFTPGSDLPVAALYLPRADLTIMFGILICFDCEFPEPARVLALKGASVFLISTAICDDATPRLMVPCRAAENHVALLYSNLTGLNSTFPSSLHITDGTDPSAAGAKQTSFCGQSAIINPVGEDLLRTSRTDIGLFCCTVNLNGYMDHKARNDYLTERRPALYADLL